MPMTPLSKTYLGVLRDRPLTFSDNKVPNRPETSTWGAYKRPDVKGCPSKLHVHSLCLYDVKDGAVLTTV